MTSTPEKLKDTRRRIQASPAPWALDVTGSSAPEVNQAVEIAARVIEEAQFENATRFAPGEWKAIADSSVGYASTTEAKHPGEELAGMLLARCSDYDYDIRYGIKIAMVTAKLQKLKHSQRWALLYTLKFYWQNAKHFKNTDLPWWSPKFQHRWREALKKGGDPVADWYQEYGQN